MTIKNFKTIIITADTGVDGYVGPSNTFSVPIFLQFVPTHFIAREICYSIISSAAPVSMILLLKTSLLNNESIFALTRVASGAITRTDLSLDLKYKMNPSTIKGNYDFTVVDINGLLPDVFTSIQIALTIEFIEEI